MQNDFDPAGGAITIASAAMASGSSGSVAIVTINGTQQLQYTPAAGADALGIQKITYTITNGTRTSQPATVSVDVTNDLPEMSSEDIYYCSTSGELSAFDFESDPLTFSSVGSASGFPFSVTPIDATTSQGNFDVPASYDTPTAPNPPMTQAVVKANDGYGDSNLVTFTLDANGPGVAGNSYIGSVLPGETVTGTLPEFEPGGPHSDGSDTSSLSAPMDLR